MHAFLLSTEEENLTINLFDFTTDKDKSIISEPLSQNQKRRRKKQTDGHQEKADEKPHMFTSSCLSLESGTNDSKPLEDTISVSRDAVPEYFTPSQEVCADKSDEALKDGSERALWMQDVEMHKSPQRVGSLREKLLRLAPSTKQQNAPFIYSSEHADTHSTDPTGETETDCRNADEKIGDAEEEVVPVIAAGSSKPVRDSKSSTCDILYIHTVFCHGWLSRCFGSNSLQNESQ